MSDLIIVESPSKAKTLKNYLGKGYEIVASKGHIRDLPEARLSVDVKKDFEPKYAIVKGKEGLVKELKEAVKKSDKVYLATDPDREGEAISWHLAHVLGLSLEEENRITFNEITKTGVKNGMASPRKVDIDLVNAQQARRILDRLVGYKLSPFVSQKIRRGLSAGRVQSVAVRMIVDREEEIRAFVPEEYWTIDGKFLSSNKRVINASFYGDETGKLKLENEKQADEILSRLDGASFSISSLKKGTRKKNPSPPFITSTLQQEASRRLGFRPERTMKIAQELYEGVEVQGVGFVGLITYMRTDSLRISEEARAQADSFVRKTFGDKYMPEKPRYYKSRSNAQDGHEAIRPSSVELTPEKVQSSLSPEQYKLYSLIWRRFLASLMSQCVQNTTKLEIKGTRENEENRFCLFTASGYSVKFDGYTVLYDNTEADDKSKLPDGISDGDSLKKKEIVKNQHFTQPPPRYTEEALIKSLEENGVGRPSTYATIISTITKREYVSRKAKQLYPTELGEAITKLLKEKFPTIVNTKFTAQMETDLDKVGEGQQDYIKLLHLFYVDFADNLAKVKKEMEGVKIQLQEDITDIPCENCGRMMVVKVGRFGKFLACPGYPECKTTKPFKKETPGVCPKCAGKVIERKSKKGRVFYGCDKWPECDFVTWDSPTKDNCPNCGKTLFKSRGGVISCLAEGCGYKTKAKKNQK
ncbi:MAG: type I DNA topoisomerase [Clostridia bacterium]|nr:type I DNA topoisomerase [Clostridia bacterium]